MNKIRWEMLLMPIISILLGLYVVMRPWSATEGLCVLLGWLVLGAGAVGVVYGLAFQRATLITTPLLPTSMLGVIIGLFFILNPGMLVEIVGLVICVFLLVEGMTNIQNAMQHRRWGDSGWWVALVVGIACLVLGVWALFVPGASAAFIMRIIGFMLLFSGATNLIAAFFVH